MSEFEGNILSSAEVEMYVQHLTPSKLDDLGSPLWFESHHRLQKLSQQSSVEAGELREEFVKDIIISFGKIPVLIHEAILIQVWRGKVFKEILKMERQPKNTFIAYIILYHEVTAVSLLQNVLYHKDSHKDVDDGIVDLIDYCAAEIVRLLSQDFSEVEKSVTEMSNLEELAVQHKTIGFNIGLASICILSYLVGYLEELPLSVADRIYSTHDVPLLLTNLLQTSPWKRFNSRTNIVQIYDNGTWKNAEKIEGVPKYEGQCWIALRYLLLDPKCAACYEFTDFRKQHLFKVQKHLHETVIDQISPLIELKQMLAQLSFNCPSAPQRKPLLMETIPEIKTNILAQGYKKWKKLTAKHVAAIFDARTEDALDIAKRLGETYNIDHLERLLPEGPICSACGDPAAKKCSKCKLEWYCGRECQVKRWPKHKNACGVISDGAAL